MIKIVKVAVIASVIGLLGATFAPIVVRADSNTLHKVGNAIQYPVRKAAEHISVGTHRAMGHNSVVRNRPARKNYVVTPSGKRYPMNKKHHHHHATKH